MRRGNTAPVKHSTFAIKTRTRLCNCFIHRTYKCFLIKQNTPPDVYYILFLRNYENTCKRIILSPLLRIAARNVLRRNETQWKMKSLICSTFSPSFITIGRHHFWASFFAETSTTLGQPRLEHFDMFTTFRDTRRCFKDCVNAFPYVDKHF